MKKSNPVLRSVWRHYSILVLWGGPENDDKDDGCSTTACWYTNLQPNSIITMITRGHITSECVQFTINEVFGHVAYTWPRQIRKNWRRKWLKIQILAAAAWQCDKNNLQVVMENNGSGLACGKVMISTWAWVPIRDFSRTAANLMVDKMNGYRVPCLDNAYHLMATW